MKPHLKIMTLDGNHHGARFEGPEGVDWETKRLCASVVTLGGDSFDRYAGRRLWGLRFYLYGPTGANISWDIGVVFDHCPLPSWHRHAPERYDCPPGWSPTVDNINALPEPIRRYVHDLETLCDPAGIVLENHQLRQQADAVGAMAARLTNPSRKDSQRP